MQNILTTFRKESTLQIKGPVGKTFRSAVFLLVLMVTSGEVIARSPWFQSLFTAPGIGSPHRQFEMQLGRLKHIYEDDGKIDCVFIGSSTVWQGFNPVIFHSTFNNKTGKNLRCFNFGVDGLTAFGAGAISQILVDLYHPRLLIYGTDPRDFSVPIDSIDNTAVVDIPWVQYRLGNRSLSGWLFDQSQLLQYQEPMRAVLHLQFHEELRSHKEAAREEIRWGYYPISTVGDFVSMHPNQNPELLYVQGYDKLLSNYRMLPDNIAGFEQMLSQQNNGTQVFVVEMPVAPHYKDFFDKGEQDYERYINQILEYLEAHQVPFLRTDTLRSIPLNGWADYNHLNNTGGNLFSEWLGTELGRLYLDGNFQALGL